MRSVRPQLAATAALAARAPTDPQALLVSMEPTEPTDPTALMAPLVTTDRNLSSSRLRNVTALPGLQALLDPKAPRDPTECQARTAPVEPAQSRAHQDPQDPWAPQVRPAPLATRELLVPQESSCQEPVLLALQALLEFPDPRDLLAPTATQERTEATALLESPASLEKLASLASTALLALQARMARMVVWARAPTAHHPARLLDTKPHNLLLSKSSDYDTAGAFKRTDENLFFLYSRTRFLMLKQIT